MALSLEEAMHKLGEFEANNKTLISQLGTKDAEIETLRGHKTSLETDLGKARNGKQEAEAKVTELTEKLPKDGSRVLSKADAERFDAFTAFNLKPDEIKTKLEQAATDHQTAVSAGNEKALSMRGLSPDVLELKKFDGAIFKSEKVGDKVKTTVTQDDKELDFEVWQKEKGLEGTLKNFVVQSSGVPVLGQTIGDRGNVSSTSKTVDDLNAARAARPNPLIKGDPSGNKNQVLS